MRKEQLLAQILAQIPDCPHHLASAYLLEFVEQLRTQGERQLVQLDRMGNQGYTAQLPGHVLSVEKMFADGEELSTELTESQAIRILHLHPPTPSVPTATMLMDEYGAVLTDEYAEPLEI